MVVCHHAYYESSSCQMRQKMDGIGERPDQEGWRRRLMKNQPQSNFFYFAVLILILLGMRVIGLESTAYARVTQINITATEAPTFGATSFGSVGQYERIQGIIIGEVDPNNPQNAVIVDLD